MKSAFSSSTMNRRFPGSARKPVPILNVVVVARHAEAVRGCLLD